MNQFVIILSDVQTEVLRTIAKRIEDERFRSTYFANRWIKSVGAQIDDDREKLLGEFRVARLVDQQGQKFQKSARERNERAITIDRNRLTWRQRNELWVSLREEPFERYR